jgi:hypothetical protein
MFLLLILSYFLCGNVLVCSAFSVTTSAVTAIQPQRLVTPVTTLQNKDLFIPKDFNSKKPLMGIEIETSSFKMNYSPSLRAGFNFETHNTLSWVLEEDTYDPPLPQSEPLPTHRNNLEMHSVGGFRKEGVQHIAEQMRSVLNILFQLVQHENVGALLTSSDIEIPLRREFPYTNVTKRYRPEDSLDTNRYRSSIVELGRRSIASPGQVHITPQITYQTKLEHVEHLLKRLSEVFTSRSTEAFLILVDPSLAKPKDQQLETLKQQAKEKLDLSPVAPAEHESFCQDVERVLKTVSNPKLRNFIILFSFYVYHLFDGRDSIARSLKSQLPLMSRVPFSHLYHYVLSTTEQQEFTQKMLPLVARYKSLKLIRYRYEKEVFSTRLKRILTTYEYVNQAKAFNTERSNYNLPPDISPLSEDIPDRINLEMWYKSIVSGNAQVTLIKPDLLSSAPGTSLGGIFDSMGAYRNILLPQTTNAIPNLPIFELRGLAGGPRANKTIDGSVEMFYHESGWFFDQLNRGEYQ